MISIRIEDIGRRHKESEGEMRSKRKRKGGNLAGLPYMQKINEHFGSLLFLGIIFILLILYGAFKFHRKIPLKTKIDVTN